MSNEVFANGMEISCKSGDGKVIAAFPDVCLSPPSPPAGPVPVPYPDTSFSKDMKNGSKTVKIDGKEVMLKDQSFYKTSPLGNEAATRSFGAGVVSHVITGKTYFIAWSMDVQFEGMNVDRHLDLTTSNHASPMGDTPSTPETEGQAKGDEADDPKCPCCKQKPPHAHQIDPDTEEMYQAVDDEMDWYKKAVETMDAKVAGIPEFLGRPENKNFLTSVDPKSNMTGQQKVDAAFEQQKKTREAYERLKAAREKTPPCENLHPPDSDCGKHFIKTNKEPKTGTGKDRAKLGFNDNVRLAIIQQYRDQGRDCSDDSPICHKTPLAAGGCPSDEKNLIPKGVLSAECKQVDDDQGTLQSIAGPAWSS